MIHDDDLNDDTLGTRQSLSAQPSMKSWPLRDPPPASSADLTVIAEHVLDTERSVLLCLL